MSKELAKETYFVALFGGVFVSNLGTIDYITSPRSGEGTLLEVVDVVVSGIISLR